MRFEKAERPGELLTDGLNRMPGIFGHVMEACPALKLGDAGPEKREMLNDEGLPELREIAVISTELADGEHRIWPGGTKLVIREGEVVESPPPATGEEGVYVVRCFPVRIASAVKGGDWTAFNLEVFDGGGLRFQDSGLLALTLYLPPGKYRANRTVFDVDREGKILINGQPQERVVLEQPAPEGAVPSPAGDVTKAIQDSTGLALQDLAREVQGEAASVSLVTDRGRRIFLEGEELNYTCVLRSREALTENLQVRLSELSPGKNQSPGPSISLQQVTLESGPGKDGVAHLKMATNALKSGDYEIKVSGKKAATAIIDRPPNKPEVEILHEDSSSRPTRLVSYPLRFKLVGRHRASHMNYHIWSWASDNLKDGGASARDSIRRLERAGFDLYIGQNHGLPRPGFYPARGHVEENPALPPAEAFYVKHADELLLETFLAHRVAYFIQPGGSEERCIKHSLEFDLQRDLRLMMLYAQVYHRFPNFLGLDYHDDADIMGDGEVLGLQGGVRFGSYMGKMSENYETLWRRPWEEPETPPDRMEYICSLLPGIYRSWGRALKRLDPTLWGAAAQQSGGGGWRIPTAHRELDVSATQAYSDGGCFPYQNEITAELFRAGLPDSQPVWVHAHGGEWGLRGQHIQVALSTLSRKVEGLGFWPGGFEALIWERNDGADSWFNQFQKYGRAERTALIGEIVRRYGDTILALEKDRAVAIYNDRFGPTGPYWGGKEQAWIELLKAHYPAVWVTDEDILFGRLKDTRVLFLEGTGSVIPPVLEALKKFIASGGIVAGDTTVKLDLPGMKRLDFAFGAAMPPMPAPGAMDHWFLRSQARKYFQPIRKFMKEQCLFEPWADADNPDVYFGRLFLGPVELLFVLNDKTPWEFSDQWAQRYFVPEKFTVSLPGGKVIYDLFDQEVVPVDSREGRSFFTADLRGIFGRIYALLPEPPEALEIQANESVRPGHMLTFTAQVKGLSGKVIEGPLPLEVVVRSPDRQERYRLYRSTGSGMLKELLKIAGNDPVGNWELEVRELLTGKGQRLTFEVPAWETAIGSDILGRHLIVDPHSVRNFLLEGQELRILLDHAQEGLAPGAEELAGTLRAAGCDARVEFIVPEMLQKHPTVWYYDGQYLEQVDQMARGRVIAQSWAPNNLDVRKATGIRIENNRPYNRGDGPWPTLQGNLILFTARGNILARALQDSPYLLARDLTGICPGPGGSVSQRVHSPFWGGSDVLLVHGAETEVKAAAQMLARLVNEPPPPQPARPRWTPFRPPAPCLGRPGSAAAWNDWQPCLLSPSTSPMKSGRDPFTARDRILEGKAGEPVHCLAVSPDGQLIAVGVDSYHKNIFLFNGQGQIQFGSTAGTTWQRRVVWDIQIRAAAKEILVNTGGSQYRFDHEGRVLGKLPPHFSYIMPDGQLRFLVAKSGGLACYSGNGDLLWYYDDRQTSQTYKDIRCIRKPMVLTASKDGRRVAAVFRGNESHWFRDWYHRTGTVILDGNTGKLLWQRDGLASEGMRFAEDGSLFATVSGDNLQIYDDSGNQLLDTPVGGDLREVRIAPGGRFALLREYLMERVQILAIPGGERVVIPLGLDTASMDLAPDGKLAAVGCWDHFVYLIELETGNIVRRMPVKGGSQVKFMPDGGVVAGSNAGWVHQFSPDGRELWAVNLQDPIFIPDYYNTIRKQKEPEVDALSLSPIPLGGNAPLDRLPAWIRRSPNLLKTKAGMLEFQSDRLPASGLYAFRFRFPPLPVSGSLEVSVSQSGKELVHARSITEGYAIQDGLHTYDLLFKAEAGAAADLRVTPAGFTGGLELSDAGLYHLSFPRPNLVYAPGAIAEGPEGRKKAEPVVPKLVIESLSWGHTSGKIGTAAFLKPSFEATFLTNGVPYDVGGPWTSEQEVQANRNVYVGAVLPKGFLEITLPKPQKMGCLVVYFNPATPGETAREYLLEGWDAASRNWKPMVRRLDPSARDWHLGPAWHQGEGFLRHPSDRYAQIDPFPEPFTTDKVRFWPIWTGNERQSCSEVEIYGWPLSETEQEQEMFEEPGDEKEEEQGL